MENYAEAQFPFQETESGLCYVCCLLVAAVVLRFQFFDCWAVGSAIARYLAEHAGTEQGLPRRLGQTVRFVVDRMKSTRTLSLSDAFRFFVDTRFPIGPYSAATESFRRRLVHLYQRILSEKQVNDWNDLENVLGLRCHLAAGPNDGPVCGVWEEHSGKFCCAVPCADNTFCARHRWRLLHAWDDLTSVVDCTQTLDDERAPPLPTSKMLREGLLKMLGVKRLRRKRLRSGAHIDADAPTDDDDTEPPNRKRARVQTVKCIPGLLDHVFPHVLATGWWFLSGEWRTPNHIASIGGISNVVFMEPFAALFPFETIGPVTSGVGTETQSTPSRTPVAVRRGVPSSSSSRDEAVELLCSADHAPFLREILSERFRLTNLRVFNFTPSPDHPTEDWMRAIMFVSGSWWWPDQNRVHLHRFYAVVRSLFEEQVDVEGCTLGEPSPAEEEAFRKELKDSLLALHDVLPDVYDAWRRTMPECQRPQTTGNLLHGAILTTLPKRARLPFQTEPDEPTRGRPAPMVTTF